MPVARSRNGIAWRVEGPLDSGAAGEPVLLIMGLGASSRLWYRTLPAIKEQHRAILLDNRGTGDSAPVRSRLTMRDLAEDALSVLDAAEEGSAHVVGASMGGMIAQHIALDHPERVRSLVLACTTAGGRAGAPPWRLMLTAALRPLLGTRLTFPFIAQLLYARATLENKPKRVREDLERRIADRTSPLTTYAQMCAISGHDTRARLGALGAVPTLVLHGEEDALVPPERARELAKRIPGARLVMLPSCGHIVGTDAQEETAAAIVEHLNRCAAGSAQRV